MAAAEITITGVLYDKLNRTSQQVVLIGEATYTNVGVGGGPAPPGGSPPGIWGGGNEGFPTHPIAPGGPPPGIWPSPGHPAHPIAPGGQPPGIWGGGNVPMPTPPIYFPPNSPPVDPPTDTSRVEWKSGWTQDQGWVTVGIITPEVPIPTPSS
jgi:hypothetical protein